MKYLDTPAMTEDEAIRNLGRFVPFVADTIRNAYDSSFHRYCELQYQPPYAKDGEENVKARGLFYATLREFFAGKLSPETIDDAIRELDDLRVIQTGPHSQMIIADSTLEALLVSYIGSRANDRKYLFWYSCSTNKLQTKRKTGAGWLRYKGRKINVFGYPRNYLANTSVICSSRPAQFKLSLSANGEPSGIPIVEGLRAILPIGQFESATDAFKAANENLWPSACLNGDITLVNFDEFFFSHLLVKHIQEETLIARILFGNGQIESLLRYLGEAAERPVGKMLPTGTEMFWALRDGRIRPIEICGGRFREKGRDEYFEFSCDVICKMLNDRKIIPNLFLIFLLCNILPGFRCLGGYSQTAYLEIYRQTLVHCMPSEDLQQIQLDSGDLKDTNAWGMRVLFGRKPGLEVVDEYGLSGLLPKLWDATSGMTLRETTSALQQLRTHESWLDIFRIGHM